MSVAMSQSECENLLSEPHIAVVSVARRARAPLCVPMWYAYEPGGDVGIWTGKTSAKAKLMERYGRFSLCVQNEKPPYKFASVEGVVTSVEPIDYERHLRPMVYRYLGCADGEQYLADYGGPNAVQDDLWIRMRPESWYSEDYSTK